MTPRSFRLRRPPSGHRQCRLKAAPGCGFQDMAPPLIPGSSAAVAARGAAAIGVGRLLAVAAPHAGAVALMLQTEPYLDARIGFVLAWGILNFFWIALLRRPALSGALSLTLVVLLILLSRLKHDVVQMTADFIDVV